MDSRYSTYQQQNGQGYPTSSMGGMPSGASGTGLPPGMQISGLNLNRMQQQQQQGISQYPGNSTSPMRTSGLGQQNFVPPSGDLLSMLNNKQQQQQQQQRHHHHP